VVLSNLERVLASLSEDDRVLDVGGWAAPLNRADWVVDLMPYETRGVMAPGSFGPGPERFTKDTWVQFDVCDRDPWPFEDDYFDFVFSSQTLEDLRDPIGVCREMQRVGKRGYAEVPSILDELTWRVAQNSGGQWCGHMHHRWLIVEEDGGFVFAHKPHNIHTVPSVRIPREWAQHFTLEDRGLGLFWEGELRAREAVGTSSGQPLDMDELAARIHEHFDFSPEERRRFTEAQVALTAPPELPPLADRVRNRLRRLVRPA
jgi:hypothetical protein